MWDNSTKQLSFSPKDFKKAISEFHIEFGGYTQQDTHEFLSFLLDCLHEDTNLTIKRTNLIRADTKQTLNLPKQEIHEISTESWSRHLANNWSLFGFLFTGQLASQLMCAKCKKSSWTFEPFNTISLPMPSPNTVCLNLVIIPLPSIIQQKYSVSTIPENSKPKIISVEVVSNSNLLTIANEIHKLHDTGLLPSSPNVTLEFCSVSQNRITQVFDPTIQASLLDHYQKIYEIYVFETICGKSKTEKVLERNNTVESSLSSIDVSHNLPVDFSRELDIYSHINGFPLNKAGGLGFHLAQPVQNFVKIVNRVLYRKPELLWKKIGIEICGNPFLLSYKEKTSNRALYDLVWERITGFLRKDSIYNKPENLWWNQANPINHNPFTLNYVIMDSTKCYKCPWFEQCLGCMIMPDIQIFNGNFSGTISIDWNSEVYNKDYFTVNSMITEHESVKNIAEQQKKPLSIYELFTKFTSPEEVDKMNCSGCNLLAAHYKCLSFFRLPPIIIIHLKRHEQKYFFNTINCVATIRKMIN